MLKNFAYHFMSVECPNWLCEVTLTGKYLIIEDEHSNPIDTARLISVRCKIANGKYSELQGTPLEGFFCNNYVDGVICPHLNNFPETLSYPYI